MKELDYLDISSKGSERFITTTLDTSHSTDNLVKDLMPFKDRFVDLPRPYLLEVFLRLLKDTLMLVAAIVGPLLTTTSGYIYLNMVGKAEEQGSFGLYSFLYFAFNVSIIISSMEKLGIELSKTMGRRDFAACKNVFSKGALTSAIFFCTVTLPVVLFTEKAFLALGVDPTNARLSQQALSYSIPIIFIMIIKELLQAFCMSQGHEHYFGNMGLLTSSFAIVFNYFTIVRWNLGILGWVLSRTIATTIELAIVLYVYCTKTNEKSRGVVSLQETLLDFQKYFFDAVKFSLGTYSEYLGFEIAGIFVLMGGNQYQTAAYYSVMNVAGLTYTFGISFSCVARTRLNLLMGMNCQKTAKNFYEFMILSTVLCGVVMGLLIFTFRDFLASAYASSHPELNSWTKSLLIIMALAAISEACATTGQIGLKTAGGIGHLLRFTLLTLVLGNSVGGPIFLALKANVLFPFGWTMLLTVVLNCLVINKALTTDWSLIRFVEDDQEPKEQELKEVY